MAILKMSSANNIIWQSAFLYHPLPKSLSIDSVEQSIYFAAVGSPAAIIKLSTETGGIISGIKM